jgi:dihydrodipicolinate synthase/N-acetylneuraminate lyase
MKECLPLRGIVTVLNTPFAANDELDAGALRRHVRQALAAGVAGFLAPAMASEVDKLTPAERDLFVDTVLDEVRGRAVVIGGASAASPTERVRLARRLVTAGCDGVLVSIPYENDEQYSRAVREVADTSPPFLMLQDWDPHGYGVPVPTLVKLFETVEAVRAVKVEVVLAGRKYSELRAATGGRLHVSGGWAVMQMIEALDRGVQAFMPTALHPLYVRIYHLHTSGKRQAAIDLFNQVLPILAFANQHLDISIHFFKRLLFAQGIYPTPAVRPPILPFDDAHARMAQELIARACALEAEVENVAGREIHFAGRPANQQIAE